MYTYIYICIHIRYISDMNHFESNGSSWLKKTKSTRLDPRWGRPAISGPIPGASKTRAPSGHLLPSVLPGDEIFVYGPLSQLAKVLI